MSLNGTALGKVASVESHLQTGNTASYLTVTLNADRFLHCIGLTAEILLKYVEADECLSIVLQLHFICI